MKSFLNFYIEHGFCITKLGELGELSIKKKSCLRNRLLKKSLKFRPVEKLRDKISFQILKLKFRKLNNQVSDSNKETGLKALLLLSKRQHL